ncbi:hypothetical protein CNMCM5623_006987 [Aspergillus felis]|uniref:Uncharacterized protein n=1 Tax=Aspergillus felis TaxID=1287682 RepID=A0A8H6PVZ1_9EURO|nr:hypothetical protein CNMCM5623_006987 [Aspergillus felis]KAF7182000.1 hypothetical protein CNMCM7691_001388 [Aspergillus felis]
MATRMASAAHSGVSKSRQAPAAASGSGGRNPDRNNGDRRGPGEGKVKKAKKKGQWCVFCRRWGHEAATCRVGTRVLAALVADCRNQEPPPPPPRPRDGQNRPRMVGPNSRERREERRRQQRLQQMQEQLQQLQIQAQEDEREQRVDAPQGEEKDTTREADHQ